MRVHIRSMSSTHFLLQLMSHSHLQCETSISYFCCFIINWQKTMWIACSYCITEWNLETLKQEHFLLSGAQKSTIICPICSTPVWHCDLQVIVCPLKHMLQLYKNVKSCKEEASLWSQETSLKGRICFLHKTWVWLILPLFMSMFRLSKILTNVLCVFWWKIRDIYITKICS